MTALREQQFDLHLRARMASAARAKEEQAARAAAGSDSDSEYSEEGAECFICEGFPDQYCLQCAAGVCNVCHKKGAAPHAASHSVELFDYENEVHMGSASKDQDDNGNDDDNDNDDNDAPSKASGAAPATSAAAGGNATKAVHNKNNSNSNDDESLARLTSRLSLGTFEEYVRTAAYYIAERSNFTKHDAQCWHEAEQEIIKRHGHPK